MAIVLDHRSTATSLTGNLVGVVGLRQLLAEGGGALGPDIYLLLKSNSCCWFGIVGGASILRNVTVHVRNQTFSSTTLLYLIYLDLLPDNYCMSHQVFPCHGHI